MKQFFLFLLFLVVAREASGLGIAAYPDHMSFQGKEKQQIIIMNPNPEQVEVTVTDTANILSFGIASKTIKANSKTTVTATPKGNSQGETEIIVSFSTKSAQGMLKPAVFIPATISQTILTTGLAVSTVQKTAQPAIGIFVIVAINLLGITAYFIVKGKTREKVKPARKPKPAKEPKPEKNKEPLSQEEPKEQEISLY